MCNTCFKLIKNQFSGGRGVNNSYSGLTLESLTLAMDTLKCPAMKALEELTPGGSEFWEDPQFCLKMLKGQRADTHALLIKTCAQRNELSRNAAAGSWGTGLVGWDLEVLVNAIDRDLAVIRRTCKHCLGEYTGTAFAICSECGRFQ